MVYIFLYYFHSIELPKSELEFPAKVASRVKTCIRHYKGAYIINKTFNTVFGTLIIPHLKIILILIFIFCFFALVRLFEDLNSISFAVVAVIGSSSMILLILITMIMSNLYNMSAKFSTNLVPQIHQITDKKKRRLLEFSLKSCHLIRCQVGNLYHMEAKAKLTTLDNTITGLVFLLVNVKM